MYMDIYIYTIYATTLDNTMTFIISDYKNRTT